MKQKTTEFLPCRQEQLVASMDTAGDGRLKGVGKSAGAGADSDAGGGTTCAVGAGVFLLSLVVYLLTVAPGLSGQDSGELIASAHLLGIAHPPGYPLWCLLGKAMSFLPLGTIAYRINLLSCVCGAGTAALTAVLTHVLSRNAAAAVCAGLCLAFSQVFWSFSVVAQTKTLNTLFIMLLIVLLFRWERGRPPGILCLCAFLYGLACTNHPTIWPLGLLFGMFVLWLDPRLPARCPGVIALASVLFLLGLSVYLYLPIRSEANTYMNWGNPRTFHDTVFHILRKQYPSPGSESSRSLALLIRQVGRLADFMLRQFTPFLAGFAALGFVELVRRRNWPRTVLLAGVFGATSLGFVVLTNFKIEAQDILVNSLFFVSAVPAAAVFLGLGFARFTEWLEERSRRLPPAFPSAVCRWSLALALPLFPFLTYLPVNNYSRYYYAYDYGANILETLEPGAIYVPSGDHSSFTVMYLQAVEGRRPDVTVADKYGYVERELYAPIAGKFPRFPEKHQRAEIERWLIVQSRGPVYFTTKREMSDLPGYRIAPVGILYRVFRPGERVELHPEVWRRYRWRNDSVPSIKDYTANLILSEVHYFRGLLALEQGQPERALDEFQQVAASAQDMKEVYNNLGSSCAEKGLLRMAAHFYERAVAISPQYLTGQRNLAFVCRDLGEREAAIRHFRAASALAPNNLTYPMELGVLLESAGQKEEAIEIFSRLAQLDPQNYFFFTRLGFLYRDQRRDTAKAAQYFRKALALNRDQPEVKVALEELGR